MATVAPTLYHEEPRYLDFSLSGKKKCAPVKGDRRLGNISTVAGAALLAATGLASTAPKTEGAEVSTLVFDQNDFFVDDRALLIDEIRQYEALEAGWDGEPTDLAPHREAIYEAIQFVESLPPFADVPEPMVSSDGQVGLYWQNEKIYLDVGFRGRGECTFFGKSGKLRIKGKEPVLPSDPIPAEILTFLARSDQSGEVLV